MLPVGLDACPACMWCSHPAWQLSRLICPQEELEQWLAAATQKEEDNLALERYRRQDEARVKELGMQLEQAAREAHQTQRDLDDEITETQVGCFQLWA